MSSFSVPEYRGRFAPSPSGNLHFGSLVTALASYLMARQAQGKWLLRIDDIDTPRVKAGAAENILNTLEAHGLTWDESVLYQSNGYGRYESSLEMLNEQGLSYYCDCTRAAIKSRSAQYDGYCRDKGKSSENCAVRIRNPGKSIQLVDELIGDINVPEPIINEDFVLRRRDGIWGYHLVAVIDDLHQGITQVVRGADLLMPSACQLVLYSVFGQVAPSFLHVPLAVSEPGKKLSKQNHSPELNVAKANSNLQQALNFLGLPVPNEITGESCDVLLGWAIENWNWRNLSPATEKKVADIWC